MNSFRYQGVEATGAAVKGVIEAEDQKSALQLLSDRGLFPSILEPCAPSTNGSDARKPAVAVTAKPSATFARGICRKEITA